jgi:hypothetical protein
MTIDGGLPANVPEAGAGPASGNGTVGCSCDLLAKTRAPWQGAVLAAAALALVAGRRRRR